MIQGKGDRFIKIASYSQGQSWEMPWHQLYNNSKSEMSLILRVQVYSQEQYLTIDVYLCLYLFQGQNCIYTYQAILQSKKFNLLKIFFTRIEPPRN